MTEATGTFTWNIYILKSYMAAALPCKELALALPVPICPNDKNMKLLSAYIVFPNTYEYLI